MKRFSKRFYSSSLPIKNKKSNTQIRMLDFWPILPICATNLFASSEVLKSSVLRKQKFSKIIARSGNKSSMSWASLQLRVPLRLINELRVDAKNWRLDFQSKKNLS